MTTPGETRKCNRVQQEQIWKDYVHHEEKAIHTWRSNWGFLCDDYQKMREKIFKLRQEREKRKDEEEKEEEEDDEELENKEEEEEEEEEESKEDKELQVKEISNDNEEPLKLPPLAPNVLQQQKASKIPFPYPLTTSQEIGWRSARPECKLERFGKWARPKKSILKHFNWTVYACP